MKHLLQVEDDPNDVYLLNYALKKAGVTNTVHVVEDGLEAINYLKGVGQYADREAFPLPSLILLDLKLPHVMGLEVLKWIRSQPLESVAVIILTASSEEKDVAAAYKLGANAFLTKPSEASKFESIARSINDFWLTHNVFSSQLPFVAIAPAPGRKVIHPPAKRRSRRQRWVSPPPPDVTSMGSM